MIEIYAWNTKIFKNWGYRYTKSKIDWDFTSCWTKKKTKAKVLLNNFPVVYLDYGQEKLTEIKKKISMRENKKWAVPSCDPIIKLYSL